MSKDGNDKGRKGGNNGLMGTINFLSKEQADKLSALGFKYVEQKINSEQIVYSFIDTPEIRKIVSSQFAKNDFYIRNTVCL